RGFRIVGNTNVVSVDRTAEIQRTANPSGNPLGIVDRETIQGPVIPVGRGIDRHNAIGLIKGPVSDEAVRDCAAQMKTKAGEKRQQGGVESSSHGVTSEVRSGSSKTAAARLDAAQLPHFERSIYRFRSR